MSDYSGKATFDFYVERYQNLMTKEFHSLSDDLDNNPVYELKEVKLIVKGSSFFEAANVYGPPENCNPEGGEVEIISVIGPDGKDWEDNLTEYEHNQIIEKIDEEVIENLPSNEDEREYNYKEEYDEHWDYAHIGQ
jgi:hypothetical protein